MFAPSKTDPLKSLSQVISAITFLALGACAPMSENHVMTAGPTALIQFAPEAETKIADTYGERERAQIVRLINNAIGRNRALDGLRVEVVVLDIKANRPTMTEMTARPGLSYQSFGVGGARLHALAYGPDGAKRADITDGWYETNIASAASRSTWSDAGRAISITIGKLADAAR